MVTDNSPAENRHFSVLSVLLRGQPFQRHWCPFHGARLIVPGHPGRIPYPVERVGLGQVFSQPEALFFPPTPLFPFCGVLVLNIAVSASLVNNIGDRLASLIRLVQAEGTLSAATDPLIPTPSAPSTRIIVRFIALITSSLHETITRSSAL